MKKAKSASNSNPVLRNRKRFWPYGIVIFLGLLAIDQYTKNYFVNNYAVGESHQMLPWLWYTYVQNTGTIWGLFGNANAAFIWLSIIAFGMLIYFHDEFRTVIEKICFALIMAGLWGNLIDRGVHGFVVDFIDLGWWPVFNIADACISVGIVVFLLEQWRKPSAPKKSR